MKPLMALKPGLGGAVSPQQSQASSERRGRTGAQAAQDQHRPSPDWGHWWHSAQPASPTGSSRRRARACRVPADKLLVWWITPSRVPVDDVLTPQVVERQRHLADVESDHFFRELDVLLQVVAQVAAQQQVHHHEHVLLVLEGVPGGARVRPSPGPSPHHRSCKPAHCQHVPASPSHLSNAASAAQDAVLFFTSGCPEQRCPWKARIPINCSAAGRARASLTSCCRDTSHFQW